jgi:hypothetical protein
MIDGVPLEIPDAYFQLIAGFNLETIEFGWQDMVRSAVRDSVTESDRNVCHNFLSEVLTRVSDDQKLHDLIIRGGARIWIEKPAAARFLLEQLRDELAR